MIRVLHVLTGLGTGGTENLIMNWYRAIDRSKVQFDFLIRSKDLFYEEEIRSLGGKIYLTDSFPKHAINNYLQTENILKMVLWEVIHVHGNAAIYVSALVLAKKCSIPCRIMHSHSVGTKKKIYSLVHYINRLVVHKYATVRLACSGSAGKWMFGKDSFSVLKNGLKIENFLYNEENRQSLRKELKLEGNIVVGHVGRLTSAKNHEYLFEIFKEIQSIKQEVKLLIVGSGELEKHLRKIAVEQGIDNNIIFLGRRDDVPRILSAMDIFVFPSRYEGLGNVLIEAQINGLYCYVSSEAVTKEVKITENIEFLSIKKPASFWANRIVNNYDDSRNRKVNLQEMENSGYSIDEIVKRLEKIYLRGEENEKSISYNGGL